MNTFDAFEEKNEQWHEQRGRGKKGRKKTVVSLLKQYDRVQKYIWRLPSSGSYNIPGSGGDAGHVRPSTWLTVTHTAVFFLTVRFVKSSIHRHWTWILSKKRFGCTKTFRLKSPSLGIEQPACWMSLTAMLVTMSPAMAGFRYLACSSGEPNLQQIGG